MAANVARSLLESPDFLRLGLMLALERRPEEPRGRAVFLQIRAVAAQKVSEAIEELFPTLDTTAVRTLTTYAVAGADGLFVPREVDGDTVDLVALFALHARRIHRAATDMVATADMATTGNMATTGDMGTRSDMGTTGDMATRADG